MQATYEVKVVDSELSSDLMTISGLSKAICECGWSSFSTMFHYDAVDWATLHGEKAHNANN
jgi:hypothetical protein